MSSDIVQVPVPASYLKAVYVLLAGPAPDNSPEISVPNNGMWRKKDLDQVAREVSPTGNFILDTIAIESLSTVAGHCVTAKDLFEEVKKECHPELTMKSFKGHLSALSRRCGRIRRKNEWPIVKPRVVDRDGYWMPEELAQHWFQNIYKKAK